MSQMLKSSGSMAAATLTSRLLGMVREMVYARFMGDGWVAGAFQLAFTIPNLFRRLLGEGALTAAFIPIFKEKEKTHGEVEMWRTANAVISGLVVAAAVIIGLVMLGVSVVLAVHQFAPKRNSCCAVAGDVSLHVAGLPGGGVHGHAQCAWTFLHPGHGRNDAQHGDDCVRALAGAAHGA